MKYLPIHFTTQQYISIDFLGPTFVNFIWGIWHHYQLKSLYLFFKQYPWSCALSTNLRREHAMQAAVINTTHHKWLTCYVLGWDIQTDRHTQKCTHEATNFGSMTSTWTWLCVHGQVALHPKKESFGEMTFTKSKVWMCQMSIFYIIL